MTPFWTSLHNSVLYIIVICIANYDIEGVYDRN